MTERLMTKVVCGTFAQAIPLRIFIFLKLRFIFYGCSDVAICGIDYRIGWEGGEALAV